MDADKARSGTTSLESSIITVRAYRYDPLLDAEPSFETHKITVDEPTSVMVLMRRLREYVPDRACRMSMCFKGACGSCLVRVNGKNVLGCSTIVTPGETITLEPHPGFEHIRDLVVDFSHPRAASETATQ